MYRVEGHMGGTCGRLLRNASGLVLSLLLLAVEPAFGQTVEVDRSGNMTVGGNITVKGTDNVSGNLTVGETLNSKVGRVTSNLTVGNELITKEGKVSDNLNVDGILTTRTAKVTSTLDVSGVITGKDDLKIDGNMYLKKTHLVYDSRDGVIDWSSAGALIFRTLPTQGDISNYINRMVINGDGSVVIPGYVKVGDGNGSGPNFRMAKFEVRGSDGDKTWKAFNFYARGNPWESTHAGSTGAHFQKYSIYADQDIGADKFIAFSDARIKNILGRSDAAADLKTLLKIEITDYRYKDVVTHGDSPQKKVIAQQVETVYPQAVGLHTDVVPDIYKMAPMREGWVALPNTLKKGDRVKLIGEADQGVYTVTEATAERFHTDFQSTCDHVFVYGREVNDFRTVDYEAIAMLNVSATQQIKKEKDAEINALQRENETLRTRIEALESRDQGLDARIAAIQAMLTKGKTFTPHVADNPKD